MPTVSVTRSFTAWLGLLCAGGAAAIGAACTEHMPAELELEADAQVTDAGAADGHDGPHLPPPDEDEDAEAIHGPHLLSETGLYSDIATRKVSADLIEFVPRFEFWSDSAKKNRYLYLPAGTKIDTSDIDNFVFPVGTKAFKEFVVAGKLVETRLLMKVKSGTGKNKWWMAAYVWNEDGSDAVARLDGVTNALGSSHDVPSQEDCVNCHGDVSDVLVGVSAIQLAKPDSNALAALYAAGKLTTAPPVSIDVPGAGVTKDALAYLHANCGHCHNDRATRLNMQTRMRLGLLVGQKTPDETGAYTTTVGTVMKHTMPNDVTDVVVKGDPERSGLYLRMGLEDTWRMPPAGTKVIDEAGRETIRQWLLAWQ